MNKIVRRHYPASRLPEELREGVPDHVQVKVVVEWDEAPVEKVLPSLEDLFARARPSFSSREDVERYVREMRDEWD